MISNSIDILHPSRRHAVDGDAKSVIQIRIEEFTGS